MYNIYIYIFYVYLINSLNLLWLFPVFSRKTCFRTVSLALTTWCLLPQLGNSFELGRSQGTLGPLAGHSWH